MSMDDGNYLNTIVWNDSTRACSATEDGEQDGTSNQNPTSDPGSLLGGCQTLLPPDQLGYQFLMDESIAPVPTSQMLLFSPEDRSNEMDGWQNFVLDYNPRVDSQDLDECSIEDFDEINEVSMELVEGSNQQQGNIPSSLNGHELEVKQRQANMNTCGLTEIRSEVGVSYKPVHQSLQAPQRGSRPESVSGIKGVYTQQGNRGFLVNTTHPNWKGATQWRTFSTAREAGCARDAVEFYRGQDFEYNNPELEGTFPPLPSHLQLDSVDDLQKITKFVQKQAREAACRAKDRGERGGSSSLGTSSLGATSTEQHILPGEGKTKRPRESNWTAKEIEALLKWMEEGLRVVKGKELWDYTSQRLEEEHGFFRCSKACEDQWGTLLKRHDRVEKDLKSKEIDPRDTSAWGRYWENSGEQSSKNDLLKLFSLDCYDRMNRIHEKKPRKQTRGNKKPSGPPASRFASEMERLRNTEGRQSEINEEFVKTSKEKVKLLESELKLDILEYGGKQGSCQTDNPENLGR